MAMLRALCALCLLLLLANQAPVQYASAQGESCPIQLNHLVACRQYVQPGTAPPGPECCSALAAVTHDCACSTIRIMSSLPTKCNIAPVVCSA